MSRPWRTNAGRSLSIAAGAFLIALLSACLGDGATHDTALDSSQPGSGDPFQPPAPLDQPKPGSMSDEIAVWGDSTTSGIGASEPGLSYPAQLQALTGRSTFNGGVSGQTSAQIAARQGGAPAHVTLPNNTLPPADPVVLQAQSTTPITEEGPGPLPGTIGGFHGTLRYQAASNNKPQLVFARDAAGMMEYIPADSSFSPDTYGRETKINVFWMGQNNFYDPAGIKSDIAKSIAFLANRKFIVMSLLNAGSEGRGTAPYQPLAGINADLARTYPDNFLDIRKILVNSYNPALSQDVQDYNQDVPPDSLRNDDNHLNDKGYAIVARHVADFITAKGW